MNENGEVARLPFITITYDPSNQSFRTQIEGDMPIPPLIGNIELLKAGLIDAQRAQMMHQMQRQMASGIRMPDGTPASFLR